jgi:hypothetical protein
MQGDLSFYVSPFDKRDSGQLVCGVFNQGCMWGIDPIQGSSSSRTDAEGIERQWSHLRVSIGLDAACRERIRFSGRLLARL